MGVRQDYSQAARWYKLAADQGHVEAQNNLGLLFNSGLGVPMDAGTAMSWIAISCRNGYKVACDNYAKMNNMR